MDRYGVIRQDIRRELGHGHRAEHLVSEMERIHRRAKEGGLGLGRAGDERDEYARSYDELVDILRREGMDDLVRHVEYERREYRQALDSGWAGLDLGDQGWL
jgi:hypothetical protein